MTNLLAAIIVSLSTNITTVDNAVYEQIPVPCPDAKNFTLAFGATVSCAVHHGYTRGAKVQEATEKTDTITVTEITHAEFLWNGEKKTVRLSERIVSQTNQKYALKNEWIKQ